MRVRSYMALPLVLLLIFVAALMIGAMRQESATIDEPVFLGAGWSYWHGYRFRFNPEHPPLAQLLAALPLTAFNVKLSAIDNAVLNGQITADPTTRWDLLTVSHTSKLFPHGPDFYYYPFDEQGFFGEKLLYGGQNNGEQLLFWGRIPEVLWTLLTGLLVFLWARSLQGEIAGGLAATMFLLNPVVLAYGHIIQSDIGLTLTFPLAVWMFARLLEAPGWGRSVLVGATMGLALATKYSAVILIPTSICLWLLHRWRRTNAASLGWKRACGVAVAAWGVIMLSYVPHWLPAPPIDPAVASKLAVPNWFLSLRPILIPAEYFKGLSIDLQHAANGSEAYLNGAWSHSGWWYYFPLALAMKTPLPFLIFVGAGLLAGIYARREMRFAEFATWASAAVYLLCVMQSKANLGVRHVLVLYPLLSTGAACALTGWIRRLRHARRRLAFSALSFLAVMSLAVVASAYPWFICYMNPLAGGTKRGYEHLLDSNYDWGQDVKRLKQFLDRRGIQKVYLQYFGAQEAIDYYGIANNAVDSEAAQQIQQGWLVISVQALMHPQWQWLRESYRPVARVGYTLFVYQFGKTNKTAN